MSGDEKKDSKESSNEGSPRNPLIEKTLVGLTKFGHQPRFYHYRYGHAWRLVQYCYEESISVSETEILIDKRSAKEIEAQLDRYDRTHFFIRFFWRQLFNPERDRDLLYYAQLKQQLMEVQYAASTPAEISEESITKLQKIPSWISTHRNKLSSSSSLSSIFKHIETQLSKAKLMRSTKNRKSPSMQESAENKDLPKSFQKNVNQQESEGFFAKLCGFLKSWWNRDTLVSHSPDPLFRTTAAVKNKEEKQKPVIPLPKEKEEKDAVLQRPKLTGTAPAISQALTLYPLNSATELKSSPQANQAIKRGWYFSLMTIWPRFLSPRPAKVQDISTMIVRAKPGESKEVESEIKITPQTILAEAPKPSDKPILSAPLQMVVVDSASLINSEFESLHAAIIEKVAQIERQKGMLTAKKTFFLNCVEEFFKYLNDLIHAIDRAYQNKDEKQAKQIVGASFQLFKTQKKIFLKCHPDKNTGYKELAEFTFESLYLLYTKMLCISDYVQPVHEPLTASQFIYNKLGHLFNSEKKKSNSENELENQIKSIRQLYLKIDSLISPRAEHSIRRKIEELTSIQTASLCSQQKKYHDDEQALLRQKKHRLNPQTETKALQSQPFKQEACKDSQLDQFFKELNARADERIRIFTEELESIRKEQEAKEREREARAKEREKIFREELEVIEREQEARAKEREAKAKEREAKAEERIKILVEAIAKQQSQKLSKKKKRRKKTEIPNIVSDSVEAKMVSAAVPLPAIVPAGAAESAPLSLLGQNNQILFSIPRPPLLDPPAALVQKSADAGLEFRP